MNGKNCHEITYFDLKKDNGLMNQNCTSPEYFGYTPCCTVDCGITKYQVTETKLLCIVFCNESIILYYIILYYYKGR